MLCGDPIVVSSRELTVQIEESAEEKEAEEEILAQIEVPSPPTPEKKPVERINVLELGAHSVLNDEAADLAA